MKATKRRNRKGRAIEGMIMGIKKELAEEEEENGRELEGIIIGRMKIGREGCKIIGVHANGDMEIKQKKLEG